MALQSVCPALELPDPKADYRNSIRIEQYRISDKAIYFAAWPTTKYLPFAAVRQAWIQQSSISLIGTCGKELPVTILRIRYKGNYYQTFTFDKEAAAQKALDILQSGCPDAIFPPEPVGPKREEFLTALSAE